MLYQSINQSTEILTRRTEGDDCWGVYAACFPAVMCGDDLLYRFVLVMFVMTKLHVRLWRLLEVIQALVFQW